MADKITPNDPRVQYKSATLNGVKYGYILAEPQGQPINTIFLIHGWPDFSFGWRYQIPLLTSLGLRVVVPDMMGYGGTDAPESSSYYTFKRASDDVAALAKELGVSSIILGGHDWGGAVVFRIALWYPKLISAIFSVCTPFTPPSIEYRDMAQGPTFTYQKQLRGAEVEAEIVGKEKIGQFLNGMYGGRSKKGEATFSASYGCYLDRLDGVSHSPLLSKEEMEFYVERYAIHGMHGPLSWYRTGELNFEDEKELAKKMNSFKFDVPVLYIGASKDTALPPALSKRMDGFFQNFSRGEVDASHWALWEKPVEVNQYIKEFLVNKVGVKKANL